MANGAMDLLDEQCLIHTSVTELLKKIKRTKVISRSKWVAYR